MPGTAPVKFESVVQNGDGFNALFFYAPTSRGPAQSVEALDALALLVGVLVAVLLLFAAPLLSALLQGRRESHCFRRARSGPIKRQNAAERIKQAPEAREQAARRDLEAEAAPARPRREARSFSASGEATP